MGLLGLWRFGASRYLWYAGLGLAGMVLTKETYIIHIGCAIIALPVAWLSHKIRPANAVQPARQLWNGNDLLLAAATSIAIIVFFYSGTFFHWAGVKGLYLTFSAWFETGQEGHGHEKPWYYWFMLIGRHELPVALGLITALGALFFRDFLQRYIAICAVGILAAYSIVHYKTPWCVISIAWPFLLIFGAAVVAIYARSRAAAIVLAGILLGHSLIYAIRLNYMRCSTETEPYVYVQTYNEIDRLTDPLLRLARHNPVYYQLIGHIIRNSAYPLPWILGDFPNVGYYEHDDLPAKLDADFLLVQEDKIEQVEARLGQSYFIEPLTIRPYQDPSRLYFSYKTFRSLFPGRSPELRRGAGNE